MTKQHCSPLFRMFLAAAVTFAVSAQAPAQTPPDPKPTPPPAETPAPESTTVTTPPGPLQTPVDQTNPSVPPPEPTILSGAAGGSYDRRDSLPNVNIYLPEGQASIRLRK